MTGYQYRLGVKKCQFNGIPKPGIKQMVMFKDYLKRFNYLIGLVIASD
jgi:hypothetical protein